MLVSLKQLQKETNRAAKAGKQKTIVPTVKAASQKEKSLIKSLTRKNIIGKAENLEKRKEMIAEKGLEPADFAYDRAIGKNDSLYSNFTELIALTKRKVGRIVYKENSSTYYATGFMVSKHLMLTNWHVFEYKEQADEGEVYFFYEYDVLGHPVQPVIFKFDTSTFINDQGLDYCLVAVQPEDVTHKVKLESIGYLYLDKTLGKLGDVGIEKMNIIHHPQGDYKQISIRENTFDGIERTKIFYTTDTAQGSSGSPVFNDQWQVVALHHKSIAKMTKDGKHYLDKKNNIIPDVGDKIDISKIIWLKNEGIRISVILDHLAEKYPGDRLISEIFVAPPKENLDFIIEGTAAGKGSVERSEEEIVSTGKDIRINIPVDALSDKNSININLSGNKILSGNAAVKQSIRNDKEDDLLEEIAKADREQGIDFNNCKGYDKEFLGIEIPLPKPKKSLMKEIARKKNNDIELQYYKYSAIFNAFKKMPVISAVNVEGDPKKRLDNSKRDDIWLRDKRIDIECQLNDQFYKKSHFDKGHMSRFEDANWDKTEADALRNGIYTCFYTNACPQVVDLNRTGLWGKLEKSILEKGVKKQKGKQARISVFNGPVFDKETDRIFKGVMIPMKFYKIVLWLDDNDNPKATAFILSQEMLVDEVKFDESMRIEEEALDIDQNVKFRNYQCSISHLSDLTDIDFKMLEKYDTFKTSNGNDEVYLENDESIMV